MGKLWRFYKQINSSLYYTPNKCPICLFIRRYITIIWNSKKFTLFAANKCTMCTGSCTINLKINNQSYFPVFPAVLGNMSISCFFANPADSSAFHSRWLLLLKIEISWIVHCCFISSRDPLGHLSYCYHWASVCR